MEARRMNNFDPVEINCPYCGEQIDIQVDVAGVDEEYVQDCSVCCRPMLLHVTRDADGAPAVTAARESD
jgi:hypothetical protein